MANSKEITSVEQKMETDQQEIPIITISDTKVLDKAEIGKLIRTGSERITFQERVTKQGAATWRRFKIVCVDLKPLEYVCCNDCQALLSFKASYGTTTLNKHKCDGRGAPYSTTKPTGHGRQIPMTSFLDTKIPVSAKDELNRQVVIGLAKDVRPLKSVEGAGFMLIAQSFINIGALYGKVEASKVLYQSRALQRTHLPFLVDQRKNEIKAFLQTAPSYRRMSFTFDMWTDKYKQKEYLSISVHCIDLSFRKLTYLLDVAAFEEDKKTTEKVTTACRTILSQYFDDPTAVLQHSKSVTDGGTNVINVFTHRLPCYCHRLNTLLTWTFREDARKTPIPTLEEIQLAEANGKPIPAKKQFNFELECPLIKGALSSIKDIVSYFKRTGQNKKLEYSLKQEVPTRWSSKLRMIQSYIKSADDVKKILLENKQHKKLAGLEDALIIELEKFLTPFEECTNQFQTDKEAVIHRVVPYMLLLRKKLEIEDTDHPEIKKLKAQAQVCYDEYCQLGPIYNVACLLHPKFRGMKYLSDEQKRECKSLLLEFMSEVKLPGFHHGGWTPVQVPEDSTESKFKELEDDDDCNGGESQCEWNAELELSSYLTAKINCDWNLVSVLDYWASAHQFPLLREVAMEVLCIPASQATDERVFSLTGRTITSLRAQLAGSTVSQLTFVHKNY